MKFREKQIGFLIKHPSEEKPIKVKFSIGQLLKGGAFDFDKTQFHFKELK